MSPMKHYRVMAKIMTAGNIHPESRHTLLVEVEPEALDREAVIREVVEEAACDLLHSRKIMGYPLSADLDTQEFGVAPRVPKRDPDLTQPALKVWYLGPEG